ncbi:hypothetical protein MUO14_17720 [Halobacillus shinanisalinarum]|uniref:Uncharacterized protein n=1 Tax=Halobacillus shinanisalinarum TaxID=2932258 RepID=A0ABY4GXZ8_9BACI|nr:hypothetical protein [Halobacillus shinanisalinarum]UOQ92297.1 hypothetical protein MUO14_17720 [Halobacillus shinanisalinarum]
METYFKDTLLMSVIEAHKKIVTEGENVNLKAIGYEEGTSIDRVLTYNASTILTRLDFEMDRMGTSEKSSLIKYLNELVEAGESNESIVKEIIEYKIKL